jgi:hypothetical protein
MRDCLSCALSVFFRTRFCSDVTRDDVLGGGTERTSVPASGIIDNKETKNLVFINPALPCGLGYFRFGILWGYSATSTPKESYQFLPWMWQPF